MGGPCMLFGLPSSGLPSSSLDGPQIPRAPYACAHVVTRCRSCAGPHPSQANVCPVKKEARQLARGWRPPSPPRRERAVAPPEDKISGGPVTEEGGMEVEVQLEEPGGGWRSRLLAGRGWIPFPFTFLRFSPSLSPVWRYGEKEIGEPY